MKSKIILFFLFINQLIFSQNYIVNVTKSDPQSCYDFGSAGVLVTQAANTSNYHIAGGGGGWYGGASAFAAGGGGGSSYIGGVSNGITTAGLRSGNGLVNITYNSTTITYNFTGSPQNFLVPDGVTNIFIEVWGAEGAGGGYSATTSNANGGKGGFASGNLSVTPGQLLYVMVGGKGIETNTPTNGGNEAGWNGGGDGGQYGSAGGGASDIRLALADLNSRVIVAGGGGGGQGGTPGVNTRGGNGGGLDGLQGVNYSQFIGGQGGTQTSGGLTSPSQYSTAQRDGGFGVGGGSDQIVQTGYTVLWSTGESGNNISNLSPGTYSVTITEAGGYIHTRTVTINAPNLVCFTCPEVDSRNNGNGQANLCANVNGSPVASNVVGTQYETVPISAKTGDITFRWPVGGEPSVIPVISNIWINGVLSSAVAGPPTPISIQGSYSTVQYCFYNTNLPNAGTYTLEFRNPVTNVVLGRCTFTGNSNVATTEPTLTTNTIPTISVITNQTVCQAATPATVNFTIGDAETTDLTLMTVTATSSNTTLLPNANLVLGGTTAARTLNYTFAAGETGTTTITITVTDPSEGSTTRTFTITHLTTLVLNAASQTNIACFGNATGAASVSAATGGAGGYTYNWTPGNPTGDGTTSVTGLTAGTWTCTVTDANGCTASRTFTITQPSSALALTAASQTNIACNGNATGAASVNAATGGTGPYTYNWTPGNPTGDGTTTVTGLTAGTWTCTVTDANGCTATRNFTITQPTALAIASTSQTQESCVGASDASATVSISGGVGGYTYSWSPSGGTAASATGLTAGTYTVTATDANSCTISQVFNISTVVDITNPTIIAPADISINTNSDCTAIGVALGTPTVADNCTVASYSSDAPAIFPFGNTVVTWTVVDGLGNTATATQNVFVYDIENPNVITQNITAQLDSNGNVTITPEMVNDGSTDNCAIDNMLLDIYTFNCTNIGPNTVTLTVTDVNGNVSSNTAIVTVEDNVNPTIIAQDITIQLNASGNASISTNDINNGSYDNCGIASMTLSQVNFDCSHLGNNTVVFTVVDNNGNTVTQNVTVTVLDNINPVAIGQNITVSLNADGQFILDPALIDNGSYDNCDYTLTASPNIFGPANIGVNNVILVITDSSGNSHYTVVQVTITDNVNPVVNTQNITINLDSNGLASITANQVNNGSTDNAQIASMSVSPDSFTCDDLGANTVTLTVTDTSGNNNTGTATVTVVDNINPTITAPAAVTTTTNTACTATGVTLGTPVTADNCSVASVTNDAPASFPIGNTTVTWTVTDGSGNTATATQLVKVTDSTVPTITAPAAVTVPTNNGCFAVNVALGTPVTADNCSIASVTNDAPATFPLGTTTVTWTIVDGSSNTATATQVVTVIDTQLPSIIAPIAINTTTNTDCTRTGLVLGNAITTDNCSVASVTNDAPAAFPLGTTTVTWTVVDGSGNTATATQIVTVTDVTLPTITAPAAVNVNTNATCTATGVSLGTPVTADNCSVASVTNNAPATFPLGTTTVTWTVVDGSGNTASATQVVTVTDVTNPTITAPAAVTVSTNNGCFAVNVALGTPVTADNCSIASVTNDAPATFPLGTTTVTWTIVDGSGNTATATQVVTVIDTQLPTIVAPIAINTTTNTGCTRTGLVLGNPVAMDNCSVASVTNDAPMAFPVGSTTVTWTVTDGSGNTATATQLVTVTDIITPTVITQNISIRLNGNGIANIVAGDVNNGTFDNCAIATLVVSPSTFNCQNVGPNTVTLTATDIYGNSASATAIVTVIDPVAPIANVQNITIVLDDQGMASITADMINNNSTDNCAIASISVNIVNFNCDDLGPNSVILTVTDYSGNTSSATAIVNVVSNDIDTDFDGIKNNCDDDDDNDGILDENDNCPLQFNPDQADFDEDGIGNACDDDDDNDGILDLQDNCQFGYNPLQEDRDNDGIGDVCDVIEVNPSEAITPNGDGINDTWIIYNIENHPNNTVKVYNRWGDLVFSARGYSNEWNGSYKNREQSLPDGSSYYYQIDLDGNGTVDHDGWLYITRN